MKRIRQQRMAEDLGALIDIWYTPGRASVTDHATLFTVLNRISLELLDDLDLIND